MPQAVTGPLPHPAADRSKVCIGAVTCAPMRVMKGWQGAYPGGSSGHQPDRRRQGGGRDGQRLARRRSVIRR